MAKAKKRTVKKAKKVARRAPAKKKVAAKAKAAAPPGLEGLARTIVRLTTQVPSFGPAELKALYNPDCSSTEATGQAVHGYAGLEEKLKGWEQMQSSTSFKAKNVWTGRNTVCIEWDGTVNLRDGRTVKLREIAVHEIKNGRIQSERYYYNPMDLAPPGAGAGMPPGA